MSAAAGSGGRAQDTGELTAIRARFPGWHAWKSSAGRFWATRTGRREKPDDLPFDAAAAWAMTVDGDTAAKLREALAEQEEHAPSGPGGGENIKADPGG